MSREEKLTIFIVACICSLIGMSAGLGAAFTLSIGWTTFGILAFVYFVLILAFDKYLKKKEKEDY